MKECLVRLLCRHRHKKKLFLFLDYDGTLVPIAATPQMARPSDQVKQILYCLIWQKIPLAIVSGRTLQDLESMLPLRGIYLAGGHGGEIRFPDGTVTFFRNRRAEKEIDRLFSWLERLTETHRGFLLEHKGTSLALHFRQVSDARSFQLIKQVKDAWRKEVESSELELLEGRKVLEFRVKSLNKGNVVKLLWAQCPGTIPVYFGDDTTDEDAFRYLRDRGITVLVNHKEKTAPTAARYRVKGPEEVLYILSRLAGKDLATIDKSDAFGGKEEH
ncbi:trehalose-phosphatase [Calderihabitans maritimus]|uniref:Trehalose 6-phosphate phosphatase n=1 Tax=Calderihabitans maritimus TaxID=1246530 RepID=A0A1Z5HRU3_9FIRM|nr:trehalose-phosphatase [Calderihabitans maritimus]GAW92087.1 trehalose-phosphatase [Calderihabitans maritimus]